MNVGFEPKDAQTKRNHEVLTEVFLQRVGKKFKKIEEFFCDAKYAR